MTRMLPVALFALCCAPALADPLPRPPGDRTPSTFSTRTLGEAAARVYDLDKPLRMQARFLLGVSKAFPLESLHAYLDQHGFEIVVETDLEDGHPVPGRPLTVVASKSGGFTRDALDRYMRELAEILPAQRGVSWNFTPISEPD